jgi:phage shock protein E
MMEAAKKILSMFGMGADPALTERAHRWVDEGATLLDVRTAAEFGRGHVRGALNIPVQVLADRIDEVPGDRVVVYCRSGGRSASAAKLLLRHGKEVTDLGAMSSWGRNEDIVR